MLVRALCSLAKVDVTRNPSVQADYGVAGVPALKWFVNGKLSRLDVQARTSDALVSFCNKNTDGGPVTSTERLKSYLDQYPFVAVAYVEEEEGEVFDALSEAEGDMDHIEFVYITSPSIAADMNAKGVWHHHSHLARTFRCTITRWLGQAVFAGGLLAV